MPYITAIVCTAVIFLPFWLPPLIDWAVTRGKDR